MRNLKRALSLALAAVMVLGMMVVGAGAASYDDFSDKDEIVNTEAVSTLTALNVINGKDDGSYDPTGIITRAEMAKLICVVLNGGSDPSLGSTSTHTYTDTVGHWAEAYIEYCTQLGIVAGDGAGKFNPNNTVTATEAAKMLLVAMGYDAKFEGMVGANWAVATNVVANTKGLYSGLALDVDAGLTRDNAAQMMYNAINAKMVKYDYALVTGPNGSLTSIPRVDDQSYTILNNKFGAVRVMGIVEANEFSNNAVAMEGKTTLTITNADELKVSLPAASVSSAQNFTGSTFEVTSGKEEFGREVIIYVKPATNSTAANKATVLTAPILSSNNTVVSTTGSFGSGKTIYNFAKDNGLKLNDYDNGTGAVNAEFYTNYAAVGPTAASGGVTNATFGVYDAATTGKYGYANKIGTEIVLIDNDADGIVEKALQNTYSFGQVTKYDTKDDGSVTVRGAVSALLPSSEELANVVAYDGIAKDDYVNVTLVDDTYYITKAEVVTGNLDSYKRESGEIKNVTVDGTTYTVSASGSHDGTEDLKTIDTTNVTDNAVDSEGSFYLDAFGYAVAMKLTAASNYAYIGSHGWDANTATGFSNGTMTVYAVLEDGTAKSYVVSKLYAADGKTEITMTGASNITDDTLYKYALDGEGKIRLTQIAAGDGDFDADDAGKLNNQTGAVDYKKGEATFDVGAHNVTVTSNTVFFYIFEKKNSTDIDSVSVYVGKDAAPSVDGTLETNVVLGTGTNSDKVAAITVRTKAITTTNYMYVIDYLRTSSKGDVYQVYLDGSVQEITTNGANTTRYAGGYTFTVNGEGLYDIKQPTTVTAGTVSLKDGNSMVLTGASEYDISDAEVVLIDGKDSAATTVGEKDTVVVVYETSTGNAKKALAVYVVEEYDEDNTGATMKPNASLVSQSSDDDNKVKFDVVAGANVAAAEAEFVYSYGATGSFVTTDGGSTPVTTFTAGSTVWLKVVSQSTSETTWHKCRVVVAAPITGNVDGDDVAELLVTRNDVTIAGDLSGAVDVPTGKTLTVTGNLALDGNMKIEGTLTVDGNVDMAGKNVTNNGTFIIRGTLSNCENFIGVAVSVQPTTAEETKEIMNLGDDEAKSQWHTLPSTGLTQTVNGTEITLTGKVTEITAENFPAYQAGLEQWFNTGTIADYDAFIAKIKADNSMVAVGAEDDTTGMKFGYVLVKMFNQTGGHSNVALVVDKGDGNVVFIKQNSATKDYNGTSIDISGVEF